MRVGYGSEIPQTDMDIFQSVQGYINKMVSHGDTTSGGPAKMKILLLDNDTVCMLRGIVRSRLC